MKDGSEKSKNTKIKNGERRKEKGTENKMQKKEKLEKLKKIKEKEKGERKKET